MDDGLVTVKLTVKDAEALRAWQRAKKGIGEMQEELRLVKGATAGAGQSMRGLKRATAEAANAGSDMASRLVGGFAKMAVGAVSLQKAIGLARSEYEMMIAREKAAAGFQVSLASAQRAALRNLSGSELSPQEYDATIKRIAAKTGADVTALHNSAADALSARGTISETESLKTLGAVAKLDPSMARDEMKVISGAALDIQKQFGGKAEQALGAILTAQQTARVTSTQDFSMNAVPALAAMSQRGDSFREASALYATISQQSSDQTGARSGTALVQFAKQVVTATASVKELKDANASVTKRMEYLLSGTPEAEAIRLELVGNLNKENEAANALAEQAEDPTERAKLTGEAKQIFTLIDLLNPSSQTRKAYQATLAATPEYEKAGRRYQQNLEAQRSIGLEAAELAEAGRASMQLALQDKRAAIAGQVHSDLDAILKQVGDFGTHGAPTGIEVEAESGLLSNFRHEVERARETGGTSGSSPIEAGLAVIEARIARAEASGEAEKEVNQAKYEALKSYRDQLKAQSQRDTLFHGKERAEARTHTAHYKEAVANYQKARYGELDQAVTSYKASLTEEQRAAMQQQATALLRYTHVGDENASEVVNFFEREIAAGRFVSQAALPRMAAALRERARQQAEDREDIDLTLARASSPEALAARDKALRESRMPRDAVRKLEEAPSRPTGLSQQSPGEAAKPNEARRKAPIAAGEQTARPPASPPNQQAAVAKAPEEKVATPSRPTAGGRQSPATPLKPNETPRNAMADRELERQRRDDAEALRKLVERQTEILARIEANTKSPEVKIKNPGDPARAKRAASPPRPPIGSTTP